MNKRITITQNFVDKIGSKEGVDQYIEDYKNKLMKFYGWRKAAIIFTSGDSCGIWDSWTVFMPVCKIIFFEIKERGADS